MKIYMAGSDVPDSLVNISVADQNKPHRMPTVKFSSPCVLYTKNEQYVLRPIFGKRGGETVITIANGENISILGKSPTKNNKSLLINSKPLLNYFELILIFVLLILIVYL